MPELKICCRVASPFRSLAIGKRLGCDVELFGLYCSTTDEPCEVVETPCGDDGVCESRSVGVAGGVAAYDSGALRYYFARNGIGAVSASVGINVIGCPTALPGTPSEDIVEGDYIKATVEFDVSVGSGPAGPYYPLAAPTIDGAFTELTGAPNYSWEATADALTGFTAGMIFGTTFADGGWNGRVCVGSIGLRIQVRGYHADGSPAAFCLKAPSGGYAVSAAAAVDNDCCPDRASYSDVDA